MGSQSHYSIFSGIGKQLFLWFLIFSLLPLSIVSLLDYHFSEDALRVNIAQQLSSSTELKKESIEKFFRERFKNGELQAKLSSNVQLLRDMHALHLSLGLPLNKLIDHPQWMALGDRTKSDLLMFVEQYGYHDLYLIDIQGNILYAAKGGEEVGTNIFTDKLGDTLIALAGHRALESGKAIFSDLDGSGTKKHELDSFLMLPMFNEQGEKIGLLALEISLEPISKLLRDNQEKCLMGHTYLIGRDSLSRSEYRVNDDGTVMRARIDTYPVRRWLSSQGVGAGHPVAANAESFAAAESYINHRDIKVLGMICELKTLSQYGIHWALLAEVPETQAMKPAERLRFVFWLLLVGTTAIVVVVSVLVTRSIVLPIRMLSTRIGLVGEGDLSLTTAESVARNEIGELHGNFERMVGSLRDIARVCEAASYGDFSKSALVRGEKDVLGKAVNQMAENLHLAVRQAEVVSAGDFSVQITPWSEQDKLGTALLRMTLKLQEMAKSNKKALADAGRLAEYVNNLPTPVLSVDRDFRIVYINAAGAAFSGVKPDDALGKYCFDLFRNAHCQTRNCRIGRAMRNKRVETAETVVDPDGAAIPVRYTGAPVLDENGEVMGALEYIIDITDEKKAFLLIEKENRLQSGAAAVYDRLRGEQEMKELCNNLLSGLASIIDLQVAAMYVEKDDELHLFGTYSTMENNACREKFRFGEGVIGQAAHEKKRIVIRDIPEQSIRLVSGLSEVSPRELAVIPMLHENEVKGVLELGSLHGFKDEEFELLDRVVSNIAIAVNSVQARTRLAELLEETRRQAMELQSQQEELEVTNEELEAQTNSLKERELQLQNQHEELRALNGELEDKTTFLEKQKSAIQQKNMELEEARSNIAVKAEQLAIASKYKSEFLANMSHELRTPLNSMLLLSHNLAQNKEGNLSADQVESAGVIYSSGNDLLELINEILDLSKIEAGRVDLKNGDVALKELTERLWNNFRPQLKEKDLYFNTIISPLAPETIATDRLRLEQILRNLISNAVKFTERGGITLTMRPMKAEDPSLGHTTSPDTMLAISVTDTGIGIPLEKQKIIFEAFQQVDGSTSRKYGGTGLGLSISRELARLLGGEIYLTSDPGNGSTFTLYLPFTHLPAENESQQVVDKDAPQVGVPQPSPPEVRKREQPALPDDRENIRDGDKTILIIEDDVNFARSLIQQGHESGFKCLVSHDGPSGLALVEEFRPNAIILDVNLPEMNGWDVLDDLKKNPSLRHIPVHMMSVEEKTLEAYKKGAVGYLHKPVSREDLHSAFERIDLVISRDVRELLVVEDDPVLRREIIKLIGNGDVHTTAVGTGEEVISLFQQKKFDCMILDIGLPDITGFELLDRLEKEKNIEIPPVIIYTGRELTREENDRLYQYTDSIIVKGVKSIERLLDETALFLHRIVENMAVDKRRMIVKLYEQDAMFINKKILIVDDDMRNAFALSKILSEKQMEILIANTGRKSLEILSRDEGIDLVLMDIMMPEMDGYEAMRQIRARERYWNLPIIALTAKAMPEDREKCLKAGASDYLAKPIQEAKLFSMMRIWLYR
ncbi:MAG: response regulator [Desulfobulbaceae bacterium]|nr:response regulator [Desulfobulbaceae bacterium]